VRTAARGGAAVHRAGRGRAGGTATGGDSFSCAGRVVRDCGRVCWPAGGGRSPGRSGGALGECVAVVGEDRPGGPGVRAGVAFQAIGRGRAAP